MERGGKETIPARVDFTVDSVNKYKALVLMTTALPYIQDITLNDFFLPPCDTSINGPYFVRSGSRTDRYADGEDPDPDTSNVFGETTAHDANVISRFRKLRGFMISASDLNGRYPAFFNFPLLTHLMIEPCDNLKCDLLGMLAGLPSLKELICIGVDQLIGDIESLKVLKDNIEEVSLPGCRQVSGNFIILADFPRLKRLDLNATAVTGDIRDISDDHFLSLDYLLLSDDIFGGQYHQFQSVSEVPSFMDTVAPILRRFSNQDWCWELSEESPDWYESYHPTLPRPPFRITFVRAGPRVGWRWKSEDDEAGVSESCNINWLDPEPERDSFSSNLENEKYSEEMNSIEQQIGFYRGHFHPPTEDEYRLICGDLIQLARLGLFLEQIQARQGGG